ALFDSLNLLDNVAFPLVKGRVPVASLPRKQKKKVSSAVFDILEKVGLGQAAFKVPAQLSGGMKRRAALARALVEKPDLVFLDDPTAGLDPVTSSAIIDLIYNLHAEYGPTMIVVSQDLRRLLPLCHQVFWLHNGKIQFKGSVDEIPSSGYSELIRFVACRFDIDAKCTTVEGKD
ncbi:MAG: ATP-binding cassette domain-containing protein, partial [Candidatus Dadabacteria bacterium]